MIHPSTSTSLSTLCAAAALMLASSVAFAWDGAPVTYITSQLQQHPGMLLDLRDGNARIRDANGRDRSIPLDQLAAIIFEDADTQDQSTLETSTLLRAGAPVAQGLVVTTDNQRLRGRPVEGDPGSESLLWDGPPFGPRVLPLESLLVFRPGPGSGAPLPQRLDRDVIIFKNADRAPTFVESIIATRPAPEAEPTPPPGMSAREAAAWQRTRRMTRSAAAQRRTSALISGVVRADVQNTPTDIPLERIQAITFANPPERPSALPRAWLSDSSVVATATIALDVPPNADNDAWRRLGDASIRLDVPAERPTLLLTLPDTGPGSQRLTRPSADQPTPSGVDANGRIPLQKVEAIALDASRLVPLSSCELHSDPLVGVSRRWTPPARVVRSTQTASAPLDAFDIILPGPMQLTIDLPATATHVGGVVTLPLSARPLASCRVRVTILDAAGTPHELASAELSAKSPTLPVSAPMPRAASGPFRLRVALDPNDDGPIHDSVLLRRFLVLVAP
jgi:hypothetical protein